MLANFPSIVGASILALSLPKQVSAQEALPNLGGTYRCEPDPASCKDWGQTFMLNQTGAEFDVKSDEGHVAVGYLTSKISDALHIPVKC
jgi:hypothetical protein